ncbi:MAG: amidophosphoribosyltransferase [Peptococcaceae bacterium]|nr:amidophosphoribosyltransferase [Peptococcaceae bacterium]
MNRSIRMSEKPSEECAVFGVSLMAGETGETRGTGETGEAAGITYNGLLSLQHRGQEGAGIAVVNDKSILCCKNAGLVSEVFPGKELEKLPQGRTAVGHTSYSTAGAPKEKNAGPFVTDYLTGRIVTAHNGKITNAHEIRDVLKGYGLRFGATSDSEVVSSLIAYCITQESDIISGVIKAASLLRGAFSLVIASGEDQLIAVRDPNGFRPLCLGQNETGYVVASESCALDACGFELMRNVLPGEVVVIENGNMVYQDVELTAKEEARGLCIFEFVYFARPDSVIDGLSVYEARYNMGLALAEEYPVDADVVCGVPDSGLDAAHGYSAKSGIPLVSGFVKNRYIGRSFIYPTQSQRNSAVKLKLNPLSASIRGKRVVLVDDSIVRGTTSERIVRSLKGAGAREVHMRISSPPFCHDCYYGTDIDGEENLIANKISWEEICHKIGADSLGYISIEGLKRACEACALPFCTACFTGNKDDIFNCK